MDLNLQSESESESEGAGKRAGPSGGRVFFSSGTGLALSKMGPLDLGLLRKYQSVLIRGVYWKSPRRQVIHTRDDQPGAVAKGERSPGSSGKESDMISFGRRGSASASLKENGAWEMVRCFAADF